jgi:squalene-hopene/tetraprenyl-beta-curcumene cyclase
VLHALTELLQASDLKLARAGKIGRAIKNGTEWLVKAQQRDGGWAGFTEGPPSIEETALAVHALAKVLGCPDRSIEISRGQIDGAMRRGTSWLLGRIYEDSWTEPSPIGFYFAKLWYFEKIYPLAFTVAALRAVDTVLVRSPRG